MCCVGDRSRSGGVVGRASVVDKGGLGFSRSKISAGVQVRLASVL